MAGFTAADAARWVARAIGRPVDVVIANTGRPSPEGLMRYAAEHKLPLELGDLDPRHRAGARPVLVHRNRAPRSPPPVVCGLVGARRESCSRTPPGRCRRFSGSRCRRRCRRRCREIFASFGVSPLCPRPSGVAFAGRGALTRPRLLRCSCRRASCTGCCLRRRSHLLVGPLARRRASLRRVARFGAGVRISSARAMIRSNSSPASPPWRDGATARCRGCSCARMSAKSPPLFTLSGANSAMSTSPAQSSRCLISSHDRSPPLEAPAHRPFVRTSTHDPFSLKPSA